MSGLDHVVSDKKIFENCLLKTYLLNPWPTYAINLKRLNNFDRGTTQGLFLWSLVKIQKAVSEEMLFKGIVDARTDGRTDDWRRTMGNHKKSHKNHVGRVEYISTFTFALEHAVLSDWAREFTSYYQLKTNARYKHTDNLIVNASGRIEMLCEGITNSNIRMPSKQP